MEKESAGFTAVVAMINYGFAGRPNIDNNQLNRPTMAHNGKHGLMLPKLINQTLYLTWFGPCMLSYRYVDIMVKGSAVDDRYMATTVARVASDHIQSIFI